MQNLDRDRNRALSTVYPSIHFKSIGLSSFSQHLSSVSQYHRFIITSQSLSMAHPLVYPLVKRYLYIEITILKFGISTLPLCHFQEQTVSHCHFRYPLVNVYITMEHHHFSRKKSLFRLGQFQE